ncbi:hypothetical protein BDFB_007543, partial [Asbolus verrucosus]
ICELQGPFSSGNNENNVDNTAGVCGTIAIVSSYSQLSEFCAALDIPVMLEKTYLFYQNEVMNNAKDLATKKMINASKEEYQLAVEAGHVKVVLQKLRQQ